MTAIVHVIGTEIVVGDLSRQRCSWCGALVEDRDFSRMAVALQPGQTAEEAVEAMRQTRWEPGSHVAVDGNMGYVVPHEEGVIPEGSCMLLDPFATS